MGRDQQVQRQAITLPEPSMPRGSYSSPGYYVIDQSGAPMSDRYNTQSEAYANLHGGAGVSYLDQPQGGHLNQPWPPELHTVVGHNQGGQMYTEADLLRAMASTNNLEEQRYLMSALEEVRRDARAVMAGVSQVDVAPPNHVGEMRAFHPYHSGAFGTSSATDWLADMGASDDGMPEHMLTMGSRFFIGCHPEVKSDPIEYMTQALGVARVAASQFANVEGAVTIFMDHVANLARVDMTKIGVDQLLPWAAEPEVLPPTDSNYPGPYANKNTDVVDEPPLGEAEPLDNGMSGRAVQGSFPAVLSSHQHMSEFLFDPPTPEELAAASGPQNLDQQFGAPASSQDDSGGEEPPARAQSGPIVSPIASRHRAADDDDDGDGDGDYRYIHHRDGHKDSEGKDAPWVVTQKGTGKILSSHPSREMAIDSFKAMMRSKHGGSLHCACVEFQGNFVLRDGRKVSSYVDRSDCRVHEASRHEGSRAFSPEPTTYEEYLSRLAPGSAGVSQEFYSGAMAAHSPSANDRSVPEWGQRRPKASTTERPRGFRGVTTRTAGHVERYMDWAASQGHDPDELHTLKKYERVPGVGRATTDKIADEYHGEGPEWREKERGLYGPQMGDPDYDLVHRGANEDMLNPQAFERADESDAPSIRGSDGTGTYDPKATWLQSGEAAHDPSGLVPQTDLSEGFSNISDFPEETVGGRREGSHQAMKWSPASGMGGRGMGAGDPYGEFSPTHTYNPIGWDVYDARPHPGSNTIAAGSEVQMHGKMDPSGHLVHIRDEDGNHQTVDRRSLDRHGPHHEGSSHVGADDDDDDDMEETGSETGGPQGVPGAYEPDRSQYAESPEGQAEATRGYEEAYSSGRMIDYTGAGVDVLGTVPVQGYVQDAEHPNAEMFAWGQEPIGSPPKGAADVADVPTAGMVSAQQTGSSYPQPNVEKNARLDAWRAAIAGRLAQAATSEELAARRAQEHEERYGRPIDPSRYGPGGHYNEHWEDHVGRGLVGFPGSEITKVEPSTDYLMHGPTGSEARGTVHVRTEDGRDLKIPKDIFRIHSYERS
jgi:hypothetical protein